jgi:hypothetical protein
MGQVGEKPSRNNNNNIADTVQQKGQPLQGEREGGDGEGERQGGNKNINEYLTSIYYDPLQPGSYSGLTKFWNSINADNVYNLKFKTVKNWLKKQEGYVRHQPPPKVFPRQKILMSSLDEMWDADLLDMQKICSSKQWLQIFGCIYRYFL